MNRMDVIGVHVWKPTRPDRGQTKKGFKIHAQA